MSEVELPNLEEIEEAKGKRFNRGVALSTAIFAVVLAVASLGGNNATKEMLLAQQQASDQWAHYQAKSVREHLYRSQKMRLAVDISEKGAAVRPQYEALLKQLEEEEGRLHAEKSEIEQEAKKLEHERDISQGKDPYFDYAEALLQISIVMASIAILTVSLPIYWFSVAAAIIGAFLTADGYLQFLKIPFFH